MRLFPGDLWPVRGQPLPIDENPPAIRLSFRVENSVQKCQQRRAYPFITLRCKPYGVAGTFE